MKSNGALTGKRPVAAVILAGLFVLVAMLVTTGMYFYSVAAGAYIDPDQGDRGTGIHYIRYEGGTTPEGAARNEDAHIFLVGGTDEEGYRTDAMLLVYFNPAEKQLNILQIPRDLFVDTGYASRKANALYAYGKGALMKSVLTETFGIPIDNYVVINLACFKTVVDKLGGVKVDVPVDMDYEDPAQGLIIHLKKGEQTLTGAQAEGFVRFRYGYTDMDIGRMRAQQIFLSAFAKTALDSKNIAKIPGIITAVFQNMKTDFTVNDMLARASEALTLSLSDVRIFSFPGESWYYKGESGLTAYHDEVMYIINNYFSPYDELITGETLMELGRKEDGEWNLDGKTLVEIDENHPKFYVNPKWNWQDYLAKQLGTATQQPADPEPENPEVPEQPSTTDPGTTEQPPTTDPGTTGQPPATDPGTTEQPPTTNPGTTEQPPTDPGTTEQPPTDPGTTVQPPAQSDPEPEPDPDPNTPSEPLPDGL